MSQSLSSSVDSIPNPSDTYFLPEFTIQKIEPKREDKKLAPDEFIGQIVKRYNRDNENLPHAPYYNPISFEWNAEEHNGFEASFSYSKKLHTSSLGIFLNSIGASENFDYATIHFLCFLYRPLPIEELNSTEKKVQKIWEIFALTTGDGWRVVRPYTDYSFPQKIARRVLEKASVRARKPLVGPKESVIDTFYEEFSPRGTETENISSIFNVLSSSFRKNSSVYALSAFKTLNRKVAKKQLKIGVKLGLGSLTIKKQMKMENYEEILLHFSKISRSEPTFLAAEGIEEEKDSTDLDPFYNIMSVDKSDVPSLESGLFLTLWQLFQKKPVAGSLYFAHRYSQDFYNSSYFQLKYEGETCEEWYYRPSLEEIVQALREQFGPLIDESQFYEELRNVKMRFNKRHCVYPLIDFLHGELRLKEEVFFRKDGRWYRVTKDHLAMTQRDFYELLQESLLAENGEGFLAKPWIVRKEWTAFSLKEISPPLTKEEEEKTLSYLTKTQYSFIDEKGMVLYPEINASLYEDPALSKKLKKKRESLESLLQSKYEKNEPLIVEDLHALFPSVKKKKASAKKTEINIPEKVFELLQAKRPICEKLIKNRRKKKIAVLDKEGNVLYPHISQIAFPDSKTIEKNKNQLQLFLVEKKETNQKVTEAAIRVLLSRKDQKISKSVYNNLQKENPLITKEAEDEQYVMAGPLPIDAAMPQAEFFQKYYEKFRLLLEEEGYNRLYLEEPSFLVCDQVYANKREQVEFFDVLFIGKEKIYLYHIKEEFGQKTRDACSQIRVSAQILKHEISSNFPILRNLYANAVKQGEKTPFRLKVKEKFEALGEEGFLDLFRNTNRKNIVFVYAFVDPANRRLVDEKNPGHIFTETDLQPFISAKPQDLDVLVFLKKADYLDSSSRLTDKFLRSTKDTFEHDMSETADFNKELYAMLRRKASKFNSVIAKFELINLKPEIENLGFGFAVCQIPGNSKPAMTSEEEDILDSGWNDIDSLPIISQTKTFEIEGKSYCIDDTILDRSAALRHILKLEASQPSDLLYDDLYGRWEFLNRIKQYPAPQSFAPILQKRFENIFNKTASDPNVKAAKLIHQLNLPVNPKSSLEQQKHAYLQLLPFSSFPLTKKDLHIAAIIENTQLELFTKPKKKKKIPEKASPLNTGGTQAITLLSSTQGYQIVSEQKSSSALSQSQEMLMEKTNALKTIFLQLKPLSPREYIGIPNPENDCAFICCLQLILHSNLIEFLTNQDNLMQGKSSLLGERLSYFKIAYNLAIKSKNSRFLDPRPFRSLLTYQRSTQEDVAEVLQKFIADYRIDGNNGISYTLKKKTKINLKDATLSPNHNPNGLSKVSEEGSLPPSTETLFPLMIPIEDQESPVLFEHLIRNYLESKQFDNKRAFIYKDQTYESSYEESYNLEIPQDQIFIQIGRAFGGNQKIKTPVQGCTQNISIGDKECEIVGFIAHVGNTMKSGHYISYFKVDNVWIVLSDDKPSATISNEEALFVRFQSAYIVYLRRVVKKRKENESQEGSALATPPVSQEGSGNSMPFLKKPTPNNKK